MRLKFSAMLLLAMFFTTTASGGTDIQVFKADLSIPFGVIPGKLLIVQDHLIFVDEEKSEASFAVTRDGLRDMTLTGEVVVVETLQPVRDRSGERSRLPFRVNEASADALSTWFKSNPTRSIVSQQAPGNISESLGERFYEVEHVHFPFGNCRGRVIVSDTRLVFESLSEVGHSRQWAFLDIKQLDRKGPYELELEPFSGAKYDFKLRGKGMDIEDYRKLGDRVAAARADR